MELCSFHDFKAVIADMNRKHTIRLQEKKEAEWMHHHSQLGSRAKVTSCILQPTQVVYARAVAFTFNGYILPVRIMHLWESCIGTEKTVNAELRQSVSENYDCLTWPLPFVSLRLLFEKESDNFLLLAVFNKFTQGR